MPEKVWFTAGASRGPQRKRAEAALKNIEEVS